MVNRNVSYKPIEHLIQTTDTMNPSKTAKHPDYSEAKAFLTEKMPVSRLLLPWFIAFVAFFIIAWSWFSEIDIVSTTRGVIIPSTRMQLIQSKGTNVVKRVLVNEGDVVNQGDILVEFLQQDELANQGKIKEILKKNEAKTIRLKRLDLFLKGKNKRIDLPLSNPFLNQETIILNHQKKSYTSEMTAIKNKVAMLESGRRSLLLEISLLEQLIPITENDINRSESLVKEGIMERDKVDALMEKQIRQKKELQIKRSNIASIDSEIEYQFENRIQITENHQTELMMELLKIEQENRSLKHDLDKLKGELHLRNLVSPIKGRVNKISVFTRGAVVQSGQTIMTIVPENSPLEVEAKILNQDVGFIQNGQTVAIKLDSFNFTKYGKLDGTVRRIASGGIEDPNMGMVYPTIIELSSQKIKVGEEVFHLRPGMTVTIDVKTGRRKIADYILEPFLRYSDEALRER